MSESDSSDQTATHNPLAIANYFIRLNKNDKKAKKGSYLVTVIEVILYCSWF